MERLEGRVALVTGGGSGIGRSTACRFAEEGATVVVVDIDAEGAAETTALIEGEGGTACWFEADVTKDRAATDIVEEVEGRFGAPSVLMTAAAVSVGKIIAIGSGVSVGTGVSVGNAVGLGLGELSAEELICSVSPKICFITYW